MSRNKQIGRGVMAPSGEPTPTQNLALSHTAEALKAIDQLLDETVRLTGVSSGNVDQAQRSTSEAMVYLAIDASHDDVGKTHEILERYGLRGLLPEDE